MSDPTPPRPKKLWVFRVGPAGDQPQRLVVQSDLHRDADAIVLDDAAAARELIAELEKEILWLEGKEPKLTGRR